MEPIPNQVGPIFWSTKGAMVKMNFFCVEKHRIIPHEDLIVEVVFGGNQGKPSTFDVSTTCFYHKFPLYNNVQLWLESDI